MMPYITLPVMRGGNVAIRMEFYEPTKTSDAQDLYMVALRPSLVTIDSTSNVQVSYNPWI